MPPVDGSDKPKITDWITGISTVILVIITMVYVFLTHRMLNQGQSQLALSQDPVIVVEPAEDAQGEAGEFNLTLRNLGLSEVHDVRIYEDYFVSLTPKGGPIRLTRFGMFSVKSDSVIPELARIHPQTSRSRSKRYMRT